MNKTLVLSLATIALLGTNLNAESMYTKFQALEDEMKSLKLEVSALKSAKKIANSKIEDDEDKIDAVEVDKDSEEAQEDEEKMDVEAEIGRYSWSSLRVKQSYFRQSLKIRC